VLNVVIICVGLGVFVAGMVLRFSNMLDSIYSTLASAQLGFLTDYIYYLFYLIMGVGWVIVAFGAFGTLAAALGNRVVLIIYLILFLFIFLVHAGVLITAVSLTVMVQSYVQLYFTSFWNPVVSIINNVNMTAITYSTSTYANFTSVCQSSYGQVATILSCCDFTNTNLTTACCPSPVPATTCSNAVTNMVGLYMGLCLDMPLGIVVGYEFVTIVLGIVALVLIWIHKCKMKKMNLMSGGGGKPQRRGGKVAPESGGPKDNSGPKNGGGPPPGKPRGKPPGKPGKPDKK
jgi:hypothetical protein